MNPASMASTSIGASAGSSILGVFGNLAKGKAESSMYQYQAGVAQFNQKIAEQNRDYAYAAGEQEANRYGMKARQQIGQTRATQGASNLDVNSGSAAAVQDSEHDVAKMDMGTIRNNAARTAYGYSVEAAKYSADTGMYSAAASNSSKAGLLNAFGSILGGVSSVSSKWLQASQSGAIGSKSIYGSSYDSSGSILGSLY